MSNSDFKDAQVGDKVWGLFGNGIITNIFDGASVPITVEFEDGHQITFTLDGKSHESHMMPTLFHKKPDCFKTKVKKTVELEGYYYTSSKTFLIRDEFKTKSYPAKAIITYEEEI